MRANINKEYHIFGYEQQMSISTRDNQRVLTNEIVS